MTSTARLTLALSLTCALVGCGGGGGSNGNFTVGQVRVVNVVADAPALNARVGNGVIATVSYAQASRVIEVATGDYDVDFVYAAPDGDVVTVLDNRDLPIVGDRQTTAVAMGTLAQPSYLVIDESTPEVAAGDTEVHFLNGAMQAGSIDFYLTASDADIAALAPTASVNAGAVSDLSTLAAGNDYRLRVTPAGAKNVLYDSGPFALDSAARRLFVLGPYFGPGGDGLRAVIVDSASAATFEAEALPAAWRVANLVVDLPAIDVYAGAVAAPAALEALAEGTVSSAAIVAPATLDVTVTPAADPGTEVVSGSFVLGPGQSRTLVVAGVHGDGSVTARGFPDLVRPIAGLAQVRVVHGSPASGNVDFHVLATGTTPTTTSADLAGVPLQGAGVVLLEPGTYDAFFTQTVAGAVVVRAGPVAVTVEASGLYSIYLADAVGGGTPARVILADDFLE
jgi:hypothetical protein